MRMDRNLRAVESAPRQQLLQSLLQPAEQVIVGRRWQLQLAFGALLCNGHILIEDLPGVGKTTFVLLLAKLLGLQARRIQFTVDLLPSDILGTMVFRRETEDFEFRQGPIFSQVIVADELNRASPKTQSALLQAMEEAAVSVDGHTHRLPKPFFVFATQNPLEQAGTNPLPESQLDRFMINLKMGALSREHERRLLEGHDGRKALETLTPVMTADQLLEHQANCQRVTLAAAAVDYLQDVLDAIRKAPGASAHLSPRAGHHWVSLAKAWAYLEGRDFVLPDDFQATGAAVLAHRIQSAHGNALETAFHHVTTVIQSVPVR